MQRKDQKPKRSIEYGSDNNSVVTANDDSVLARLSSLEERVKRSERLRGNAGDEFSLETLEAAGLGIVDSTLRLSGLPREDDGAEGVESKTEQDMYPQDSYSFLSRHGPIENPRYFFFGFVVWLFQITFLIFLILSICHPMLNSNDIVDGTGNVIAIPGDVEPIVKATQVLALLTFALFADQSMNDILTAIKLFPNIKARDTDKVYHLFLSSFFRLVQGLLAAGATFLLIYTSPTAKDVVLNFAAVNFVSGLDEAAFSSAIKGYYGRAVRNEALKIQRDELPLCIVKQNHPIRRANAMCGITLIAMISVCILVLTRQTKGQYVTKDFRLEFEDNLEGPFKSCYTRKSTREWKMQSGNRYTYQQDNQDNSVNAEEAIFAYCKANQRWWLFYDKGNGNKDCEKRPIKETLARSSRTASFDIQETFGDPWYAPGGKLLEIGFQIDGRFCGKFTGDGICDSSLNIPLHGYDGGDCCADTCQHSSCGLGTIHDAFGTRLDASGDGYPYCADPNMVPIIVIVKGILQSEYLDLVLRVSVNSTPPLLTVNCDGKNHLMLTLQEGMENKNQTVMVRDGAKCKVVVRKGFDLSVVNYEIYHRIRKSNTEILIWKGTTEGADTQEFQLVPKCYLQKLPVDQGVIYTNQTTQRLAIDWLLKDITTNSECSNPFFIERYALAVMNFAAPRDISYVEGEDRNKLWIKTNSQCLWPSVTCTGGYVVALDLSSLGLNGTIATEVGLLTNLIKFEAGNILAWDEQFEVDEEKRVGRGLNRLSGTIPSEVGNLLTLEHLSIYMNELTGTLPSSLGNLAMLKTLYLWVNAISGTIPAELGNLPMLEIISLPANQLTGSIPSSLGSLPVLQHMWLSSNKLNGTIPSELGGLTRLEYLHLEDNQLSGTVPSDLGSLSMLKEFTLYDNKLTGEWEVFEVGYEYEYEDEDDDWKEEIDWSTAETVCDQIQLAWEDYTCACLNILEDQYQMLCANEMQTCWDGKCFYSSYQGIISPTYDNWTECLLQVQDVVSNETKVCTGWDWETIFINDKLCKSFNGSDDCITVDCSNLGYGSNMIYCWGEPETSTMEGLFLDYFKNKDEDDNNEGD